MTEQHEQDSRHEATAATCLSHQAVMSVSCGQAVARKGSRGVRRGSDDAFAEDPTPRRLGAGSRGSPDAQCAYDVAGSRGPRPHRA